MATGTRTTYTDTTPQKRSIADMIGMIDWTEAPLLKLLGLNNETKFRLLNFPRTKVEWLEDTMAPRSGTLTKLLIALRLALMWQADRVTTSKLAMSSWSIPN